MKVAVLITLFFLFSGIVLAGNDPEGSKGFGKANRSFGETEWIKKMCDGGLYLHIGLIVPTKLSYIPQYSGTTFDDQYGIGPHFEFGNMIIIKEFNDNSIGLRATWLSVCYSKWTNDTVESALVHGSPLRMGPYFTYELADEVGLDVFYQIGASYAIDFGIDTMPLTGRGNTGYFGFTHNLGVGVRYQMYSAGFDVNFGKIKYTDKVEYADLPLGDMFYKMSTTYARFYIGFRF